MHSFLKALGLSSSLLLALVATTEASAQPAFTPAFPGARGFGAGATGGRGGQVIKVTTLDATGPGSLQEALNQTGARIIVFDVSGVIEGDITIENGDVTIAGQTAPGGGITIAGRLFGRYDTSVGNIIVRHLRVRPTYGGGPGEQFDGAQLSRNRNVILDHLSVSWGVDETIDLYEANDVTVQFTTIEEGATMGHPEGEHNYGLINGPDGHRLTLQHNLFIHQKNRNPAVANGPAEIVNNVAYNVRHGFVHHNPASGPFNIVGNAYLRGPDDDLFPFYFDDENNFTAGDLSYYLADNYIDDPGVFTGTVDNPWSTPFDHPSFEYLAAPESLRSDTLHDFSGESAGYIAPTPEPAQDAMDKVLTCAGAFPRDVVTLRVLDELQSRNGSWGAHSPADLMQGLTPTAPPTDSDDDGMPDTWETDHGLDPNDGTDHTTVMPDGYTAIESYINELADTLACGDPGSTSSGAGGAGSGPSGGGPSSGATGTGGSGALPREDGACSCTLGGTPTRGPALTLLTLLGLAWASRRSRPRPRRA